MRRFFLCALIWALFIGGAFWCGLGVYAPGDAPAAADATLGPVTIAGGGRANTIEIDIKFLLTAIVFPVLGFVVYWVMRRHDRIDKDREADRQEVAAAVKEFEAALRSVRATIEQYDKSNLERFLSHREHMGEKYATRADLTDQGERLNGLLSRLAADVENNTKTLREIELTVRGLAPGGAG